MSLSSITYSQHCADDAEWNETTYNFVRRKAGYPVASCIEHIQRSPLLQNLM